VTPASWTLDHIGPLTRTVTDAALVMNAIAGFDPADNASLDAPVPDYTAALDGRLTGLTIGVPDELFGEIDPEFERAVRQSLTLLQSAGAMLQSVVIPAYEQGSIAQSIIAAAEAASVYEEQIRADPTQIGTNARTRIELGSLLLATDYLKAQRVRTVFQRGLLDILERVDVVITPTSPALPPRLDQQPPPWDWRQGTSLPPNRFRWPFNLAGAPSISIPHVDSRPTGCRSACRSVASHWPTRSSCRSRTLTSR
jgi:aspartyl-tRNA(Asn)/glutamyl-tRNA(Gln) amidotransferase subunit A